MLPRGLEPRTLRLLAVRSDQLSYKSFVEIYCTHTPRRKVSEKKGQNNLENLGIDPSASRMLSERSTIWASSPDDIPGHKMGYISPQISYMKMEGYKRKAILENDQNGPFPEERDSPVTQEVRNSYFFFTSKTFDVDEK